MSDLNKATLAAVEKLCVGNRADEMTRGMAFSELSQLALTGSPDSVRVKALEVLATKFPDYLDKTHDGSSQEVSVTFTEGEVVSLPKLVKSDSSQDPCSDTNRDNQRLLAPPDDV